MQQSNSDDPMSFEHGSENVFADLGLDDADGLLVKADLAHAINREIAAHTWTQAQVGERAGLTQPQVSQIMRMHLDNFSQERLQTVLRKLGVDVEIVLHVRANGGTGTLRVLEAA